MKFNIDKNDLLGALSIVQKALPSKTTNPVLEGIYVQASQSLMLMCSDSTIQIETTIGTEINETGAIVFPGRLFCEIIRKVPDGTVSIETKEKEGRLTATIVCHASKTNIQCMSADEYPQMPAISTEVTEKTFVVNQGLLKEMIKQTVFASAQDEVRPILTGVLFEIGAENFSLVALDGYRLAIRTEQVSGSFEQEAVIPASALNEIAKTLTEDDKDVIISFSRSSAVVNLEHTRINTVLLSGEYMKYKQIIPADHATLVKINRKELLNAIERASLMARESKNNLICFNILSDALVITSNSEVGNVYESIEATITGSELEIAFNAKYMVDVLSKLEDEEVLMHFNTNISPCTIEPLQGHKFLYLVLPVRMFSK